MFLSINYAYNTLHDGIRRMETAFERNFPTVWERIGHTINGPTQVDETQQACSGFKGQNPPRDSPSRGGSPEGGRTRWSGEQGDELTLVVACRDVLRVVSAEEGSKYEENLGPVIKVPFMGPSIASPSMCFATLSKSGLASRYPATNLLTLAGEGDPRRPV